MTRYEQGFMRKCAEYGVDGRALLGMYKKADPPGKGVNARKPVSRTGGHPSGSGYTGPYDWIFGFSGGGRGYPEHAKWKYDHAGRGGYRNEALDRAVWAMKRDKAIPDPVAYLQGVYDRLGTGESADWLKGIPGIDERYHWAMADAGITQSKNNSRWSYAGSRAGSPWYYLGDLANLR